MRTLVLNAGYEPLAIVSFRRALVLVMNQKASIVEIDTGHPVWATDGAHDRPSVIVLARYVKIPNSRRVPVTRRGVLRRDANRCGYCGTAASTIDHILPRSRGSGLLGEPRRLLPALQQCQERQDARRNGLVVAHQAEDAVRPDVGCPRRGARDAVVGSVPHAGGCLRFKRAVVKGR